MERRTFLKDTVITSVGILVLPGLANFKNRCSAQTQPLGNFGDYFDHPPDGCRPWCFWQWMNGQITASGITKDLEAMKNMGVGGAICFNSAVGIPRGPVDYGSKTWVDLTVYAAKEAQRLGLELALHNSPGYSGAGGPWITPEMSMQELVWSEIILRRHQEENTPIRILLPRPYAKMDYYEDAMVLAYPSLPDEGVLMIDSLVQISCNWKTIDKTLLTDKNPETKIRWVRIGGENEEKTAVLDLVFDRPFTARAISILRKPEPPRDLFDGPRDHPPKIMLKYSENGKDFQDIGQISLPELREMDTPGVLSFPAVTAKYYRLIAYSDSWLSGVELHSGPRLAGWPGKTGCTHGDASGITPELMPDQLISLEKVLDITRYMDKQGQLNWAAPLGNWTIVRIGHTTTGETNAAHPDAGKGLELDKFSSRALDFHFKSFLNPLIQRLKPYHGRTFKGLTVDSWEAGKQNWTKYFPSAFESQKKYAMAGWMLAMTGRIVESVGQTERFLWDVRDVQANLLADQFYGHFQQRCHEQGLEFYAEPYGDGNFDSLQVASHLDITMSEFWTRYIYGSDVTSKQAVSAAHAYGKKIVAAEAFTAMPATAKWTDYPYSLKSEGDYFFSIGVNRLVFHTIVHQPYDSGKPGMTMGPFGMHLDRNNSWAGQAYGWLNYVKRAQYLLQEGTAAADICYFKGDDPRSGIPDVYGFIPKGYKADVIGSVVLHEFMQINEGSIQLKSGMQYKVCMLAPVAQIQLQSIRRLETLVYQGMTLLVQSRPSGSFGLSDTDAQVREVTDRLYGQVDGRQVFHRKHGKGSLVWVQNLQQELEHLVGGPDFEYFGPHADTILHYHHKKSGDVHLYFVANHLRRPESLVVSFRLTGYQPEIWDAHQMIQYECPIFEQKNGRTFLPLNLQPSGSVFVIFRKMAEKPSFNSLLKDGQPVLMTKVMAESSRKPYMAMAGRFTISVWAKPDSFAHNNRSMIFHAPEGTLEYGEGHSAVAMGAGQNGVFVYERSKGMQRSLLQYTGKLEGWTHIVLVCSENRPVLWINGKEQVCGKKASLVLHPGLGTKPSNEQFSNCFEGNLSSLKAVRDVWSKAEILQQYQRGLPEPQDFPTLQWKPATGGDYTTELQIFNNGYYQLAGKLSAVSWNVEDCKILDMKGPWLLRFSKARHAPGELRLPELRSLHLHEDIDVRYFTGTIQYNHLLNIDPADLQPHRRVQLDLGRVEVIAEVFVNGKKVGICWKAPYFLDLTGWLNPGRNELKIAVTNLWPNRLIGDEYLPAENHYTKDHFMEKLPDWYIKELPKPGDRTTFCVWKVYDKDSPLVASGLLGPVRLHFGRAQQLKG